MKNITLAIVAALAAVAMLSAGLVVPMQQASAGDDSDGDGGGNSLKVNQKQECERASCSQSLTVTNDQSIED